MPIRFHCSLCDKAFALEQIPPGKSEVPCPFCLGLIPIHEANLPSSEPTNPAVETGSPWWMPPEPQKTLLDPPVPVHPPESAPPGAAWWVGGDRPAEPLVPPAPTVVSPIPATILELPPRSPLRGQCPGLAPTLLEMPQPDQPQKAGNVGGSIAEPERKEASAQPPPLPLIPDPPIARRSRSQRPWESSPVVIGVVVSLTLGFLVMLVLLFLSPRKAKPDDRPLPGTAGENLQDKSPLPTPSQRAKAATPAPQPAVPLEAISRPPQPKEEQKPSLRREGVLQADPQPMVVIPQPGQAPQAEPAPEPRPKPEPKKIVIRRRQIGSHGEEAQGR